MIEMEIMQLIVFASALSLTGLIAGFFIGLFVGKGQK